MNNIYSRIKTLIRHNHNRLKVAVKKNNHTLAFYSQNSNLYFNLHMSMGNGRNIIHGARLNIINDIS